MILQVQSQVCSAQPHPEAVSLFGRARNAFQLLFRNVELIFREEHVGIWPPPLEVGIVRMLVNRPPVGKAIFKGDARQRLTLLNSVDHRDEVRAVFLVIKSMTKPAALRKA